MNSGSEISFHLPYSIFVSVVVGYAEFKKQAFLYQGYEQLPIAEFPSVSKGTKRMVMAIIDGLATLHTSSLADQKTLHRLPSGP